jgi:hypothetical protein
MCSYCLRPEKKVLLVERPLSEGSEDSSGADVAASAGADWRPDAGEHLAAVSKRQPSRFVL